MPLGPFIPGTAAYAQFNAAVRDDLHRAIVDHNDWTCAAVLLEQQRCLARTSLPPLPTGATPQLDDATARWMLDRMVRDRRVTQTTALAQFQEQYAECPRLAQFAHDSTETLMGACTDDASRWKAPAEVRSAMVEHLCKHARPFSYGQDTFHVNEIEASTMLVDMVELGVNEAAAYERYCERTIQHVQAALAMGVHTGSLLAQELPLGEAEDGVAPADSISQVVSQEAGSISQETAGP